MTKRTLVTCEALFLLIVEAGAPRAAAQESANPLPAFADLKDGWNTLTPGGDTSCAVDPNTASFVRRAARGSSRGVL